MARTWILISLSIAVVTVMMWFGLDRSNDSSNRERHLAFSAADAKSEQSISIAGSAQAGAKANPSVVSAAPQPLWSLGSSGSKTKVLLTQSLDTLTNQSALLISLPSGNDYQARVVGIKGASNLLQVQAKVTAVNYEGFALITESEGTIVGTFNTPEGVYELFGQPRELTLVRASDLDAERRLGVDFQVKEEAGAEPLPQKKIQTPVPKT